MNRADLKTDEVTRIVIVGTMTSPQEDALGELIEEAGGDSYHSVGCHFYLKADGMVLVPVPSNKRGNYLPRYGSTTIVILIEGGRDKEDKIDPTTYYPCQMGALKNIVKTMKKLYPNAEPCFYRDLYIGVNPGFNHEDYQ